MKFEVHDEQIFHLLDDAVQLKDDSTMPCLVRYTEKGLVGEYNKKYFIGEDANAPFVCHKLDSDGEVAVSEVAIYNEYLPYYCFELIGTPVIKHSAIWAIYMLQQGVYVRGSYWGEDVIVMFRGALEYEVTLSKSFGTRPGLLITEQDFINRACPTGWQIYEPEVSSIETQRDACEADSDWGKIISVGKNANIMAISSEQDGTWIIGENVKPNQIKRILEVLEPDPPKSDYQVGDWVELEYDDGYKYHCKVISADKQIVVDFDGAEMAFEDGYESGVGEDAGCFRIIRKLTPKEVVLHIGCLMGTVEPVANNGIHLWFHLMGWNGRIVATIRITSLDTPTRERVESLLEAMEEDR